jgi:hypothetical protein
MTTWPDTGTSEARTHAALLQAAMDAADAMIQTYINSTGTAPTVNDDELDGKFIGSVLTSESTGAVYVCTDATAGAAVWLKVSQSDAELTAAADAAEDAAGVYTDAAVIAQNGVYVPGTPMISGRYYLPGATLTLNAAIIGEALLVAVPFYIGRDCTLDRIGVDVSTIGTSPGVVRLGLYADDVTTPGIPGALILDAGTQDGTAANFNPLTINQAVTSSVIWVASVTQGAAGTRPTVRTYGQGWGGYNGTTTGGAAGSRVGFYRASVTGALPDPFGTITGDSTAQGSHAVWLRAA